MSIMASRASLFILVSLATCFLSNHGFPQQSKEERLEINGLEGIKCDLIEDHAYSYEYKKVRKQPDFLN